MSKASDIERDKGAPESDFYYWEILNSLIFTHPNRAWQEISAIVAQLDSEREIAYVAAGPFEELLTQLGDEVAEFFDKNDGDVIGQLAPHVWTDQMSDKCRVWVSAFI